MSLKIFDCFTYYNEEKMAEFRIKELHGSVDTFYVSQGNLTYTGHPKDSIKHFDNVPEGTNIKFNIERLPKNGSSWDREIAQRNSLRNVLVYADDNDMVMISDVDEIPNMDTVLELNPESLPIKLDVKQYFWSPNWQVPQHCNNGGRPVVCLGKHLHERSPQELRSDSGLELVPDGGWHFSFFMEAEEIRNKIESFAHTEYDSEEFKDALAIKQRILNGVDPFDRFPLKWVDIDDTFPKYIQEV